MKVAVMVQSAVVPALTEVEATAALARTVEASVQPAKE